MDGSQDRARGTRKNRSRARRWSKAILVFCYLFTYHFVRKNIVLTLTVVVFMGCLCIYDATVGDGEIPDPIYLGRLSRSRTMARFNTTKHLHHNRPSVVDPDEAWEALEPTLEILHEVSPSAEQWVRECKRDHQLIFDSENGYLYATFDCINRNLTIKTPFFKLTDGEKACVLAHEWRHSRQNPTKFIKCVLCFAITRKLRTELVENDAYLYESRVRESLCDTGPNY